MNLSETLEKMSGKELVELFNDCCEEGSEVKKFRNKEAGVAQILNDFDEDAMLEHLSGIIVVEDDEEEASAEPEADTPKVKRDRSTLSQDGVLFVLSTETKSLCKLDILRAITKLGKEATVSAVIEEVVITHVAPRSKIARREEDKPAFVKGYVTDMLRLGELGVE